jgi:hypothetical protein
MSELKLDKQKYEKIKALMIELNIIPVPEMYGEITFILKKGEIVSDRLLLKRIYNVA